jgi:hypothetical protein
MNNIINQCIALVFLLASTVMFSQVTLNACHPLLENQDFVSNQVATDATGRNVFQTTPITGDQPCSGLGVCELQIIWSETNSRWEIQADDGNGTFDNTYLLYYNDEASLPNPPSLMLGTWVENTAVTASQCGLVNSMSGDVQDTVLGVETSQLVNDIQLHPNPASSFLTIASAVYHIDSVNFYDINGRMVLSTKSFNTTIDISSLKNGLYFAEIIIADNQIIKKLMIQ